TKCMPFWTYRRRRVKKGPEIAWRGRYRGGPSTASPPPSLHAGGAGGGELAMSNNNGGQGRKHGGHDGQHHGGAHRAHKEGLPLKFHKGAAHHGVVALDRQGRQEFREVLLEGEKIGDAGHRH